MNFIDAIYKVKELGFDAAETYNWKDLDLTAVRTACNETGVELLSMCTTEFNMTDPEMRQNWLAGLKESCEAAKIAGVKRLITQVGNDTGEERQKQHESIVMALREAKPILEDSGVTVMIEPLNTLVDHKGYYLWQSAEAFDIIREVDDQYVKVVYDIYHQQVMEGNIIPNIVITIAVVMIIISSNFFFLFLQLLSILSFNKIIESLTIFKLKLSYVSSVIIIFIIILLC